MTRHFPKLLLALLFTAATASSKAQSSYTYLLDCFKQSKIDTFETEIDHIGEVINYVVESQRIEELGMIYYAIPKDKQSIPLKKMAVYAAARQIDTWKNNSKLIYKKQTEADDVVISDVRLHILLEDLYMQVIVVCEKGNVYEITCIRDKNDIVLFDSFLKKVTQKECF